MVWEFLAVKAPSKNLSVQAVRSASIVSGRWESQSKATLVYSLSRIFSLDDDGNSEAKRIEEKV